MGEKTKYLESAARKGFEIGANKELSPSETVNEFGKLIKNEFTPMIDLSQARRTRIAAVAQRLRILREESGAKQKTVAEATGISVMTLSRYETEKTEPHFEAIIRLADFYGVTLDYILCRTDTKEKFNKEEYTARDAERNEMNERIRQLERQISEIKNAIK